MMVEARVQRKTGPEVEAIAARRARDRARSARWDLDVAIFLFAVLIIVVILLFQGVGTPIVAPVALFGLVMVWLVGWRRERQLYWSYYDEELSKLVQESLDKEGAEKARQQAMEETVEARVQKELYKRWQGRG